MAPTIRCSGLLLALGITAAPAGVLAATSHGDVQKLLVRDGSDAGRVRKGQDGKERPNRQVGIGMEQVQVAQLQNGELMMFGIGSYRINGNLPPHRMQMLCGSVKVDPMTGPKVAALKYVTNLDGDRYRNGMHPRVTPIFGGKVVAVSYNYAPENHAQSYTQVFGPGCEPLSEPVRIMAKNNDNCSENKKEGVVVTQTDTYARVFQMDGCNGNGSDDAWVSMVKITNNGGRYTVAKEFDLVVENDEERSRGTVMLTPDPNTAMACWTAGNTQPPNKGVRCGAIDISEGTPTGGNRARLLWRKYIEQRTDNTYRTEVRTVPMLDSTTGKPTGKFIALYEESNRRRRNGKGSQTLMGAVLEATPTGLTQVTTKLQGSMALPGADATHGEHCGTLWGDDGVGVHKQFVMSGSYNGDAGALSTAYVIGHDTAKNTLVTERKIGLRTAIDHSWLANIYGQNPNTQGRNYMHCIGNVTNPGYGVTGGYMSDVKSFVAIPATSRRRDPLSGQLEDKLALEVLLVPAVINASAQAGGMKKAPVSDNEEILNLSWQDLGPLPGLAKSNVYQSAQKTAPKAPPPAAPQSADGEAPAPAQRASAAGCSTTGSDPATPLALFGLGTLLVIRRRCRS